MSSLHSSLRSVLTPWEMDLDLIQGQLLRILDALASRLVSHSMKEVIAVDLQTGSNSNL